MPKPILLIFLYNPIPFYEYGTKQVRRLTSAALARNPRFTIHFSDFMCKKPTLCARDTLWAKLPG